MGTIVKGALWYTFRPYWGISAIFAIISECGGLFTCYFIRHLIDYLRDDSASVEHGIVLVVILVVVNFIANYCRNYYIQFGFMTAIRLRRTLVAVIFDKVTKLSMKSLVATNSGKLISVISSDLFAAERSLTLTPLIFCFPIVNVIAYIVIGLTSSWINSLIVFSVWIIMLIVQFVVSKCSRKVRFKASAYNDERLKLVNDMVVGVRTLKSYGWENHYIHKISEVRNQQNRQLYLALGM